MGDALFVVAIVAPPVVVVISFLLLALPVRRERQPAGRSGANAH